MEGHPVTANYISRSPGTSILKEDHAFCCRLNWLQLASLCLPPFPLPSLAPLFVAGRWVAYVSCQDGDVWSQFQRQKKRGLLYSILFPCPRSFIFSWKSRTLQKSALDESLDCLHCATLPKDKARKIYLFLLEYIRVHVLNTYYVNLQNKVFRKYVPFLMELKIFLPTFREISVYFLNLTMYINYRKIAFFNLFPFILMSFYSKLMFLSKLLSFTQRDCIS